MKIAPMLTSLTDEWATPPDFFARLHARHRFTLDPCATPENAKCERYFTREQDGLLQSWEGERVFCFPPYGAAIKEWVRKAWEEAQRGAFVALLIPARTDTAYWHDYVMRASEVLFIRGRLYFGDGTGRASFPSALVIFEPGCDGPPVVRSVTTHLHDGRREQHPQGRIL